MISRFYKFYLRRRIMQNRDSIPGHITLVLSESGLLASGGYGSLRSTVDICRDLGIQMISIYVDILDTENRLKQEVAGRLIADLERMVSRLSYSPKLKIYSLDGELYKEVDGSVPEIFFSAGFGGRDEITKAVRSILGDVEAGRIKVEEIDENILESRLMLQNEPDIVIRAGGRNLSDFLIWQSVYSELFFTDINWSDIRDIDILRIIRDYQMRQRRFGR